MRGTNLNCLTETTKVFKHSHCPLKTISLSAFTFLFRFGGKNEIIRSELLLLTFSPRESAYKFDGKSSCQVKGPDKQDLIFRGQYKIKMWGLLFEWLKVTSGEQQTKCEVFSEPRDAVWLHRPQTQVSWLSLGVPGGHPVFMFWFRNGSYFISKHQVCAGGGGGGVCVVILGSWVDFQNSSLKTSTFQKFCWSCFYWP